MKFLLIQCLRGTEIGKIKIEQINRDGLFYYSFKVDNKDNINFEKNGKVLFMQYNGKKECCGVAIGKVNSLIFEDNDKKTLKIEELRPIINKDKKVAYSKSIECKTVIDIIKEIKSELISDDTLDINKSHKISIININNTNFKILDNLAGSKNLIKEEEREFKDILELYNKFEKSNKLDCEKGFSEADVKKLEEIFKSYDKLERKKTLSSLAQRSIYAKRVVNKGDRRPDRTEFQRDWERIIHAKTFRRLEDKAQIYTLSKGDHFRTRLTHTLEVTQIARGIARELDLNEDLVEAIALGHDLGHTPFGHVGERTLNDILEQEGVKGGFKHNFQGVKVVNYLEEKYGEFEGIDLTYQVMEGILKHTKISNCKDCSEYDKEKETCNYWNIREALECDKNLYQIENFLYKGDIKKLHLKYNFATTLEGQVVAVADEIAQRAHDLDDGIASGIIDERDFLEELKNLAIKEFFQRLKIEAEKEVINEKGKDIIQNDKLIEIATNNILQGVNIEVQEMILDMVPDMVGKVKEELKGKSKEEFENEIKNATNLNSEKDEFKDELYIKICKSLYYIDEEKRDYIDILDIKRARIVSDVITYFISKVVGNAKKEIEKYYNKSKIKKIDPVVIEEHLIKFSDKTEEVRKKLEEITSDKVIHSEEVNCFDGKGEYIIKKLYKAYITNPRQMSKTTLTRIKREMSRYTNDELDITKVYIKNHDAEGKVIFDEDEMKKVKHQIFVRCIIDLISGMTDEFANKQFEKLYSPRTY